MPTATPEVIERFRLMAFHIAYECVYRDVEDCVVRFLDALEYSVQPIQDHELVMAWHKWTHGRPMKGVLDRGSNPPAIIRPIIDAWRKAVELQKAREREMSREGRKRIQ